jgi:TrmH family RNA methyltransferase
MTEKPATVAPGQVKQITSLANPIVKELRALAEKKHRDERRRFLGEGLKLVTDALDTGWPVPEVIYAASARENPAVLKAITRVRARGGDVLEVSEAILGKITRRDNPQMVVGVFAQRTTPLGEVRPAAGELWVALEQVRDPGNLGTILRTVDSVGAKGVILVGETCDPFSPEAVRATMGSLFHVPIARAGLEAFLSWRGGFKGLVVGTHLAGAVDYRTVKPGDGPVVLVMGNEQQGLSERLAKACDRLAKIPMAGAADSLNLAVATGVMLYELRRDALKA